MSARPQAASSTYTGARSRRIQACSRCHGNDAAVLRIRAGTCRATCNFDLGNRFGSGSVSFSIKFKVKIASLKIVISWWFDRGFRYFQRICQSYRGWTKTLSQLRQKLKVTTRKLQVTTCNQQLATELYHYCSKSCKEMGGATSHACQSGARSVSKRLVPPIGRYAVSSCKLQVPAVPRNIVHCTRIILC